jgi:hypothetical protein
MRMSRGSQRHPRHKRGDKAGGPEKQFRADDVRAVAPHLADDVRAVALTQVGVLRSPNGVSAGRAQAAALTLESVGTEAIVFRIWDAIW